MMVWMNTAGIESIRENYFQIQISPTVAKADVDIHSTTEDSFHFVKSKTPVPRQYPGTGDLI